MTNYEKLQSLIAEIDVLISHSVKHTTPAFQAWYTEAERFLIKTFGVDSFEYNKLKETRFKPTAFVSDSDIVRKCKDGLVATKMIFNSYLNEIKESENTNCIIKNTSFFNKVFIVHGHDGELKQSVARIIENQDIDAIILSELANKGRTIIEKFEENSDVGGAICLFTADDIGHAKSTSEERLRARQNVVFEAGYFMGKLGRERVVIIAEKDVELPSDMQGIVYTDKNNWEIDVLKELKAMGYKVDLNKLF